MAAPDRHEPPLAKVHRIAPVAPSKAYMCPAKSNAQRNTTPFAVVSGPEVAPPPKGVPPNGGVVCHSSSPVAASMPLITPVVVVAPSGNVHGTALLLASATYARWLSIAEPHWRPPAVPPGPAWVTQRTAPVSGSSAQY